MKNSNLLISFYTFFKNKSAIPRWIIFFLDLSICAFSLVFAYWLRLNMDFQTVRKYGFVVPIFVVTILNIIFFRLFRTYEGVIRLSSAQEGIRCVSAVFWSFLVLLTTVGVSAFMRLPYLVPTSVLIIYFFTASFLIFAYRIWVKALYNKSLKGRLIADNVLIFGTTINGVLLKNAIESMTDRSYKVIGVIEQNKNLWGKSIDHARFYPFEQLSAIVEKFRVKYLFITADDPDIVMKNKVVDYCLANNISIKVIPVIQKWINGHLQTNQLKNLRIEDLLSRPDIKLPPEHLKYMTGKTVLITGAAGSIGSEIVKQLARIRVKQLILCDNRETALHELQYELQQITAGSDVFVLSISDVRNRAVMRCLFEQYKPQVVFHAAAYKHVPLMEMHPCEAITNNVAGTKIVADLAVRYGVERFVFISTDKAINPSNVMGASKRIAEMYVGKLQSGQRQIQKIIDQNNDKFEKKEAFARKYNTKFIITRFGNVLGSNGSVIPRFQQQIDDGGPVTVTHPDIIRYFMTIPEACSLVLEAGTMGKGGEIFVFDMGEPVKIVDLANKMIKLSGLTPGKDIQVQFTGLRPGEKLYEELLHKNEEVIPTHHEKIMISMVKQTNSDSLIENVDDLIALAGKNKDMQVVKYMKSIVIEYKSKNSTFEILDIVEGKSPEILVEVEEG